MEIEKGTSSSIIHEEISPEVPKTLVESDYGKYPSLSGTRLILCRETSAVRPSFSRNAAKKCAKIRDTMWRQSVSSPKKLIVRLRYSEDQTKATEGDEEILEEQAVCNACFKKLKSDDVALKTRCGCESVLIHEKCVANWCRVVYDNNIDCSTCKKEVQKIPVILIKDLISVENESSKWSWSSWLKK